MDVVVMVTAVVRVIGVIRSNLFNFKFCGGICVVVSGSGVHSFCGGLVVMGMAVVMVR